MDEEDKKKNVPEEFDGQLDCGSLALCCSFNRSGSLLAVGCNDGRVVVWDFLTRCVAKNITAHAGHPVTSISWSRAGYKIASASLDNSMAIWEVETGECKIRWIFKAPLMKIQFNPRNDNFIIVCPYKHQPILLKVDYQNSQVLHRYIPIESEDIESNMVASFDRRGEYIYTGNSKGQLSIMRLSRDFHEQDEGCENIFETISSFSAAPAAIRDIEFAPKDKRYFLVNSTDRTIRLYSCDTAVNAGVNGNCEELRKFQEMVNKPLWRRCCFSGEREVIYVCGGSARQHALYIWDIDTGAVKKMLLTSSKGESLLDVQWHPSRPIVVSVSSGVVYIWARAEVENWSAYAPQFKELDENQEYSERESEFDIEDEDAYIKSVCKKEKESDDDISVNVDTAEYEEGDYRSSDEEGNTTKALEFIPISLEDYDIIDNLQPS